MHLASGGVINNVRFARGTGLATQSGNGTSGMFRKGCGGLAPVNDESAPLLRAILVAVQQPTRAVVITKEIDGRKGDLEYLQDQGRVRRLK